MKTSCLLILILALAIPGATYADPVVADSVTNLWYDIVIWIEALIADVLNGEVPAEPPGSNEGLLADMYGGTDPAG